MRHYKTITIMLFMLTILLYGGSLLFINGLASEEVLAEEMRAGPTPTPFPVQPLSEVYGEGGAPEIINITDTHATLHFVSSIPLACSVVYGTSSDYGLIAVDQEMNGGAIIEHNPLLTGLKADTDYHYRVQGSAADGTIYVGEEGVFRTAAASETNEVNLASLAGGAEVLEVSSNFGGAANDGTWGANSAIDENVGTAWSSNGDGNDAYLTVQLSQAGQPTAVEVWTRSMSDGSARTEQFSLTTNTNQTFGPFDLPDDSRAYRFKIDVSESIESLRLDVVQSTGGNTGLVEFGIYAPLPEVKEQSSNIYLPMMTAQ